MAHADVKHDYHLVNPSPWPIAASISALFLTTGLVILIKGLAGASTDTGFVAQFANTFLVHGRPWVFGLGILAMAFTMIGWWSDVVKEANQGDHTPVVDIGLRYGMILFIASEVMFFVAWFWIFFEMAIFHSHRSGWYIDLGSGNREGVGQLAAAECRDVRSLPPAADEHADPAALGHDGHVGAPRAAGRRPQGRQDRPAAHHAARLLVHVHPVRPGISPRRLRLRQ